MNACLRVDTGWARPQQATWLVSLPPAVCLRGSTSWHGHAEAKEDKAARQRTLLEAAGPQSKALWIWGEAKSQSRVQMLWGHVYYRQDM